MATKTNIEINGKSYYRIKRVVGYEYIDGERTPITKQFYGRSKGDAESKYKAYRDDMIRQEYERRESLTAKTRRTTGELMDYYCDNVLEDNVKYAPGTRKLYADSYKCHLKDSDLSTIHIADLTAEDIQQFYKDLDISQSAIKTLHKFFVAFMKWAVAGRYCSNVLEAVALPEKKENKQSDDIIIWTDEEVQIVKEKLSGHRYYPCIMFGLYAGLRVSEILGLKWSDIENDVIHIRRQYYRGIFKDPKAGSSRDVPLHPQIKKALADMERKSDYIFMTANGYMIDYHNFEHSLKRAYIRAGIEPKKFHAYRATFITNLCKSGVRLEIASKLAGHTSVSVTAKYYTHISDQETSDAINLLK